MVRGEHGRRLRRLEIQTNNNLQELVAGNDPMVVHPKFLPSEQDVPDCAGPRDPELGVRANHDPLALVPVGNSCLYRSA